MSSFLHLEAWRFWCRNILPKVPRAALEKHSKARGCDPDTCKWFMLNHQRKAYGVCAATGQVHVCPGEMCPFRSKHRGIVTCRASGLVIGEVLEGIDSVFQQLASARPDPVGPLSTHMGDIVPTSNASVSVAHQQRMINARSKKFCGTEANDKMGSAVRHVRMLRTLQSSHAAPGGSPTAIAAAAQFAPETIAGWTVIAQRNLNALLLAGYHRNSSSEWVLRVPAANALRHAAQGQFDRQRRRDHVDMVLLVAVVVSTFLDCNKRPPIHVAVINKVPIPPVDPAVVTRLARLCANTYPAARAFVASGTTNNRPQHYIYQAHCSALVLQSVHGLCKDGVELLRPIPRLALWLLPPHELVAAIDKTMRPRELTQCIGQFNRWRASVSHISCEVLENANCLAVPPPPTTRR